MSWNVKAQGNRAEVEAKVEADAHVPGALKKAVSDLIRAIPTEGNGDVAVETVGHFNTDTFSEGSNLSLKISTVKRETAPAPAKEDKK